MSEWIEWKGGSRPVPPQFMVSVKYMSGETEGPVLAAQIDWSHSYVFSNVIAYKVEKPAAEPAPFDPTKLRKGDRVWVEDIVAGNGYKCNGYVSVENGKGSCSGIVASRIKGYAPGYTPQPETPSELDQAIKQANEAMDNLKRVIGGLK